MGNKDPLYAEKVAARNRAIQCKVTKHSQKIKRLAERARAAGEAEARRIYDERGK